MEGGQASISQKQRKTHQRPSIGSAIELGQPPAYNGKTALTIGPKEKRVLVLPSVELDAD
jgi:hypothetical protein